MKPQFILQIAFGAASLAVAFVVWMVVFPTFPHHVQESQPFCGTALPSDRSVASTEGKQLFDANCARCHNPRLDRNGPGPALLGMSSRIPGGDWFYNWVQNSSALIKSGDPYARKIWEVNGRVQMDPFPHLSRANMDEIKKYIDSY